MSRGSDRTSRDRAPCRWTLPGSWPRSRRAEALEHQSGRDGGAERICRYELWCAILVEDIELRDLESSAAQKIGDLACQVTASEDSLLHGFEAMLPALHALVGRQAMLDESQRAAGLEHASNLGQRLLDV